MKTKFFCSTLLLVALFFTSANATNFDKIIDLGGTSVKMTAETHSVMVNLGNVTKEEVTLKIEDNDGNILLSEVVKNTANFSRKYNLSKLEDGKYQFVVTKKTIKTVQPFEIVANMVVMSEIEQKDKFLPTVDVKNDRINVNVLLGNYSNISVNIYDNAGRKVFNEENYVVLDLHKRFDVSNLVSGAYVVEIVAGSDVYYYDFTK